MPIDTYQTALDAARAGAAITSSYFEQGIASRGKSSDGQVNSHELITDADIESEEAIVALIREAFPDHQILAEEFHQADLSAEHLWLVDPLDGTNNFAHGVPHWAVSIAYYERGVPQCGVVYNPIRDDLWEARRGQGATHNGQSIRVVDAATLQEALIAVGFFYDRGEMMEATLAAIGDLFRTRIHGIRRFGTASLDLCQIAMGWYGGYFEYELAPWDYAAGRLIVEEAGGRFTNCLGQPVRLGRSSVLASNGLLHADILEIVQPHFPASLGHD